MSNPGSPDSSIVERLKKLLTEYGTELLKPCDSTEELLRKLDRLEYVLLHTLQEHKKLVEMFLQPSKEALIADELIRHSEFDVRVSAASCISQIIRITAPAEPYEEGHMKEFFLLANSAFEILSCMSGRAYSKAVSILYTMSNTQSCVMMLDLEMYATVGHMFHLFLDGIRTSHPSEVFSSMEKFMTVIIRNTVDNDEFLLVLVKILLNSLRRENQNVSSVSFQLAENTFKNCNGDLKAYRSEALTCLDVPIEDYAEVVVSFFHDATQRENMHEQTPEEEHVQRKKNRRPSSLIKAEEGYDPFWMSINRKTLEKNPSKRSKKESFPAKTKIPKDLLPKDHSEKGQGSSIKVVPVEESRGKTSVSEGLNEDIMKSSLQCRPLHSKDEAPSGRVSKQNPKESLTHLRKRCASRVVGKDVAGRKIKIWWPLDKKFYRGKILCFDEKYKLHQIDYDDGEMEFLDLRRNVGNC